MFFFSQLQSFSILSQNDLSFHLFHFSVSFYPYFQDIFWILSSLFSYWKILANFFLHWLLLLSSLTPLFPQLPSFPHLPLSRTVSFFLFKIFAPFTMFITIILFQNKLIYFLSFFLSFSLSFSSYYSIFSFSKYAMFTNLKP